MEIYHGAAFLEYSLKQLALNDLFDRAVKKNIVTLSGIEYLRNLQ